MKKSSLQRTQNGGRKEIRSNFNAELLKIIAKASYACNSGDLQAASVCIKSASHKLAGRQQIIRLADTSEGGWQTVKEYEFNNLIASDSEDEKRINRAESRAVKKIKSMRQTRGSNRFRPYSTANTSRQAVNHTIGGYPSRQTTMLPKQGRQGSCFACGSMGHWRKECPPCSTW